MNKLFVVILALFIAFFVSSCKERETEEIVAERVDSFAVHYFNWQFEKCLPYVTPESKKYLEFAATNVMEGNVELLRSAIDDATVEVESTDITDDTTAIVNLNIFNYLAADTIGRKAKFHDEGTAEIKMVKNGNNWYVELPKGLIRTAFQQQSEQPDPDQSRDDK